MILSAYIVHTPAGDQLQTIGTDIKKLSGAGIIRSEVQEHQHFRSWLSEGP